MISALENWSWFHPGSQNRDERFQNSNVSCLIPKWYFAKHNILIFFSFTLRGWKRDTFTTNTFLLRAVQTRLNQNDHNFTYTKPFLFFLFLREKQVSFKIHNSWPSETIDYELRYLRLSVLRAVIDWSKAKVVLHTFKKGYSVCT